MRSLVIMSNSKTLENQNSIVSFFPVNYTTASLMPDKCNCDMCPSCVVYKQFMYVNDGVSLYKQGVDIEEVEIYSEYKSIVIFGYIFASLLCETFDSIFYDTVISDKFRKELFMKAFYYYDCYTPICKDFINSWVLVEEGVTLFENGGMRPEMPLPEDHEDLHVNFELKRFGYDWAEASSPDYDWKKNLIEPGMIEVKRLVAEMLRKKAKKALTHDSDSEDDSEDDD